MARRPLRTLAASLLVFGSLPIALDLDPFDEDLGADVAEAELIQSFTPPVFTTNTTGAIDIVGNALMSCGTSTNCANTLAGTLNSGNGSFTMNWVDNDDGVLPNAIANQTTTSSSRASLSIPAGSTVLYAGLYWSGESTSSQRNRIDFLVPGGTGYQTLTGSVANAGSLYQGSLDVTALVAAAGSGDYWAGDIRGTTGRNEYAAWSLVVAYENASLPVRNLSVFDGFGRVRSNPTSDRTLDVPISGFLTPPFGPVDAEIGVVAYEGDRNITRDEVRVDVDPGAGTNFQRLSDASNPATNFGNGSISDAGVNTHPDGVVNNLSIDIDEFATSNLLANAQTATTVRFQTNGDWWYPGVLTTAIDLFVPEFPEVVKTVRDLNGGDALPGEQLEYTVTFTNTGNDAARDSIVSDVIPDDTTFVPGSVVVTNGNAGAGNNGQFDGTQITVPVGAGSTSTSGGTLDPGDTTSVVFRVTIDESARGTDIENSAVLDYVADTLDEPFSFRTNEVVTPVPPLARLRVEKVASPNPVASGEQVTWTITVFNDGPNTATGVTLDDVLTNSTYDSVTGATCTGSGGAVSCSLADIPAGDSAVVTLVSDTDPGLAVGSQVVNTATVSANEDDDQLGDNSATARTSARPESDLSVVKTDVADPVAAGDSIEYDLVVSNAGPSDAPDVRITDNTDGQFTITSISLDGGVAGTCDLGSRSCALDDPLTPGATVTVSVDAQLLPFATSPVTNTALVQSPNPDPDAANDTDDEDTSFTAVADLSIDKTTLDAPVVAGEQVTYRVRVTNAGPSTAQSVEVTDTLPAGLSLDSAVATQGSCSGTTAITCALGAVNAGATVDVTITASVDPTVSGTTLSNTATVTSPTDPTPSSDTQEDLVENVADLRIVKTLQQANPIIAGSDVDFTITIVNDGPSATNGAFTVSDTVPSPIVVNSVSAGCTDGGGGAVTCTSSTPLAPGASTSFTISGSVPSGAADATIDNTATVSYPDDPNTANNSSTAQVDLATESDLSIEKAWVGAVVAGSNATFTLTVTNLGDSDADDVAITDALPGGATFVSATPSGVPGGAAVDCGASAGSTVSCSYDGDTGAGGDQALVDGDGFTVTVEVAIPADTPAGALPNTGTVTSTTDDRNPDNNSDVAVATVTRSADLQITKVADDTTPAAGETIQYTVVVSNPTGPSTATGSFVGDPLPAGLTLVTSPAPTTTQGSCTTGGNTLSCDLGEITVGDSVTIVYEATVDASIDFGTALTNSASVSSPDDPTPNSIDEVVSVETEADLVVTKTASDDPATPGGELTYTVTVENQGPSDARDVVVPDPAPVGFTVDSATSTLGSCTTAVSCDLGLLPAGGTATITIVGTIDADATGTLTNTTDTPTSSTTLVNTGDDTGSVTVTLAPAADLSITKTASPTSVAAGGDPVTFTISVANAGPSDAVDVEVIDTLPAGFVVDSVTPSQGSCTGFPCDLGTLAANESAEVIVVGAFPSATAPGSVTNTASVSSPTDPDAQPGSPISDDVDVTVTRSADVSIAKAGPLEVVAGETRIEDPGNPGSFAGGLQYEIAVSNDGPSLATGVTVTDTLDTTYVDVTSIVGSRISVVPASAGACTPSGATISCSFGDLAVGELVTVVVNVDVLPGATPGVDVLDNTAAVTSTSADPESSNDSSTVETDVTQSADLEIAKDGPSQFRTGEEGDYTVTVTNNGPSDATNVVVTDTAPNNVTFGTISSNPVGCTALPCTFASVPAGATVTVTIPATLDPDANNTSIQNTAEVTGDQNDGDPSNNSDTDITGTIRRADMELVAKTDAPDPVLAGGTLSYTISARNNGPATARDATITDTVPADTTLVSSSLPPGCTTTGTAPGSTITCELGTLAPNGTSTISFDVVVDADVALPATISNTAATASDTIDDVTGNEDATATTTVGAEADLGIEKTVDPATAVPGESLTYTLTVTNAGPSTARDVVVTDDVSAIFEPGTVTATPGAGPTFSCDDSVVCAPFDLPVGSVQIEITGTVLTSPTTDLSNTASVTASTSQGADTLPNVDTIATPVAPSADLRIAKVGSPTDFEPGEAATYTITVTNDGPSDATTVVVTDTLPTEFVAGPAPAGCTITGQDLSCSIASIEPGVANAVDIVITGTISDRAVGSVENTATIASSGTPDPDDSNDTVTTSNDVVPEADIEVAKATITSPIVAGETVRWRLTVFNDGPAAAADVQVVDSLPGIVSFVNASTPVGSCSHDGSTLGGDITCDLGSVPDQTTITIDVDVLLDAAAADDGPLTNSVTASTTTTDTDVTNDSASTSEPITGVADLRIDKQLVSGDPANPDLTAGEPFEYRIIVTNDGPSDALETITVVDQLPAQIEPAAASVSISNAACSYSETSPDRTVSCSFVDDLDAGDSVTVTITGTIQSGATSVDDNTAIAATVDDPSIDQSDPDPSNNSSTATATLVTNADLALTKTIATPSTVVAGQTIAFSLSATNNGPSDALAVELTDTVPAGFSVDSFSNEVGLTCSDDGTTLTCTAASVADGDTVSVDVVMRAGPSVAAGPVNNTASITSSTPDRNPDNNTSVDGLSVTRLGELDITKTSEAGAVVAGGRLGYTVEITSNGPSSAEATVLGDVLPDGVTIDVNTIQIDGAAPVTPQSCAAPANVLTCELGELAPGTTVEITYDVVFDTDLADGTTITNEARADSVTPLTGDPSDSNDVDITTSADLQLLDKTVAPSPVVAGETVTYTITATNAGPSVARSAVITDDLPAGMSAVAASLPPGCSVAGSGDVECALGDVAVGAAISISFDAVVATDVAEGSTLTNTASISSPDTADPDDTNDTDAVDVSVDAAADVTITKSASPDPAVPGQTITYTLTVSNAGPSDAQGVTVTDSTLDDLVPGTISASSTQGACDTSVSCTIGSIAPGAGNAVVVTISGTVAPSTTAPIGNTASVSTTTDQGANASPDSATISTPIEPTTDLAIAKSLDTSPPVPGETVQYTITVTNPGPSDAQDVVVTDTIDAAVTGLTADQGVCSFAGQALTCTVGTLAPGTFTVVVTGDLDEGFTGALANTATVTTSTDQGANASPDTSSVSETAAPDADLAIAKTAAPDPVVAGETVTYTLTVTNNGPSTAIGVEVDDLLPGGLTVNDVSSSAGGCTGLPCELGDLVDGAVETVTVVAEVDSDVTDLDPNNASVTSTTSDSTLSNNAAIADPAVTTSADVVTTKTLDTSPAVPGTRVTWTIEVGNSGPSDALDVEVVDSVPSVLTGVTVSSSQGGCTSFPCDLGTLAPGGAATITVSGDLPADTPAGTLTNTATTTSSTDDPTTDGDEPTASDPIAPSADVRIEKAGPTGDLVPGRSATWTVTVTNDGPSDAQTVAFTDTLPASIDPASISANPTAGGASCSVGTPGASDVSCSVGTLAPGASFTVELSGTPLANVTDASIDNTATVTTVTPDPDPSNDSSTSTTPVTAEADLSIAKAGPTGQVDPGAAISYTITVTNAGPSDAQDVVVTDTLPSEITLLSITSAAAGASCSDATVSCTIPTVAAGASVDVVVTGTVSDRAVGTIENSAGVSASTDDPDPSDDTVIETTDITPFADLSITKSLTTGPMVAGTQDRYTITVTNDGPATATAVTVTDVLPAGLSFISAATPIGSCSESGGTVTCSLGDLDDQASVTITLDVAVAADASGSIDNRASVSSAVTDPDPSDDASTASTPVTSTPDLAVQKSLTQDQVVAGGPFTYEITVTNNGPSDALQPITLTDDLPADLEGPFTVSPSGECSVVLGTPDQLTCSLIGPLTVGDATVVTLSGTFASGASTVANTVTVATTGGETDPNTSDNSSTSTADLNTNADLVLTKTFASATAQAGGTVDFELVVTNEGPSDAVDVVLTDVLPTGFTIAAAGDVVAPGGVVCTRPNGGTELDCDLGTIIDGDSVTITVTATVDPTLPGGPVTNTGDVAAATPDRNPDNEASDQVTVTRFADLDLAKTVVSPTPPADVNAGDPISYQIVFANAGPSSAEASVVGDPLPDGVTIVPSSVQIDGAAPTAPQSCTTTGNLLTCELGEVLPTESVTITYDVVVDADVTSSPIVNNATADSPTPNDGPTSSTSTGVSTSADLELVSKSSDPTSVAAGESVDYTITIRNNGPSVARNVVIDDDLPAGVTADPASFPAGCSLATGGDVQCALGDVAVGESVSRTFTATIGSDQTADVLNAATVDSDTPDPTPGNDTDDVTTTVTTSADLVTTKSASVTPAVPGESLTYTIEVENLGPSDSSAVVVTDDDATVLLTGVTATFANGGTSASCTVGADVSCAVGDLVAGTTATVTITGTVPSGREAALRNTADAASTGATPTPDPTPGDATDTLLTPVSPTTDIGVSKTIDTSPLVPGEAMQFTITVLNEGPSDAQDVVVTDLVDDDMTGLAFVGAQPDCTINGQLVQCAFDSVQPGAGNAIDIVVSGVLDASATGGFTNTASVTTSTPQGTGLLPGSAPDDTEVTAPLTPIADVRLAKTASPDPVVAGENVTYTITATNDGPSDASGVVVSDTLPAGLTLVEVFSSQGACTALPCSLNTIPDGSSATVTVVATVDADRLDLGANTASVTADTTDDDAGNNTATATPAVTTSADLRIEKVLATPTAIPGSAIRWTLTVTNDGPSDAVAVTVDDTIPGVVSGATVSSSQGGCTGFPCDLGTVAADASATITIDAQLPADTAAGDLVNTATVASTDPDGGGPLGPTPDPDTSNNSSTATDTIVPTADLRIEKIGPSTDVVAGTDVSWTITVTNDGPSDATDVQVVDDLPAALDPSTIVIDDGGAACSLVGLRLTCDLATLASTSTSTITIDGTLRADFTGAAVENVASVSSATSDPDPSDNSDTASANNSPTADLVVTGSADPSDIPAGSTTTFEFEVVNEGPSDAAGTVVRIPLPATIAPTTTPSVSGFPGATVTVVDGVVIVDIGDLPAGVPVTITFVADIGPDTPAGPLDVTATATTTTNQSDTTNDDAAVRLDIEVDVDLSIVKTADRSSVRFGESVTFTITVTNDGQSTALDADVIDDLPDGLLATSASSPAGACTISAGGSMVRCDDLDVPAGGSVVVTIVATAQTAGQVTNTATVECSCIVASIASDPVPVEVQRNADLGVTKSASRPVTQPGLAVTFTIVVSNAGPDAAVDTVVTEQLPNGLGFVRAETTQGSYDSVTGRWSVGDLASGATATLTVRVVVQGEGTFTNSVSVSSDAPDPNSLNDTASVTITSSTQGLPRTGSSGQQPIVAWSIVAIALGVALLVFARRRRSLA